MTRIGWGTLVLGATICCTGEPADDGRDAAACERLREHVIDVRLAEIQQDREAHRVALRRALGPGFAAECRERSAARYECEMKAATIDALRACAGAD